MIMKLQNIFNVLFVLLILIQFQAINTHDKQLRALFYITDTIRDILIEFTKEKDNNDDEENTL